MRPLKYIVIHATETSSEIEGETFARICKSFGRPPFHSLISQLGFYYRMLGCNIPADNMMEDNESCYHIAYIGGLNKRGKAQYTMNEMQSHRLWVKVMEIKKLFPAAEIVMHNVGLEVGEWLEKQGEISRKILKRKALLQCEEEEDWALDGWLLCSE